MNVDNPLPFESIVWYFSLGPSAPSHLPPLPVMELTCHFVILKKE